MNVIQRPEMLLHRKKLSTGDFNASLPARRWFLPLLLPWLASTPLACDLAVRQLGCCRTVGVYDLQLFLSFY
jgi:hypothetical protein